jgi:hypothetical protein
MSNETVTNVLRIAGMSHHGGGALSFNVLLPRQWRALGTERGEIGQEQRHARMYGTRADRNSLSHYSEVSSRVALTYARLNDRMRWILREMNHWSRQRTAAETLKLMAGLQAIPAEYPCSRL